MANKNMTRVEALTVALRELSEDNRPEVVEAASVLEHMLSQLTKPKATPTVNKTAVANAALAREVAEKVESGATVTCARVCDLLPTVLSPQKAVAVMKQAITLGLFEKVTEDKRTAYRRL